MPVTPYTIIDIAKRYIGIKENPPDSNKVIFNTRYYGKEVSGKEYPWCVAFIWCLYQDAGAPELFYGGGKTASCGALKKYAIEHNQWVTKDYKPGDLAIFDWPNIGGPTDHIGLIVGSASATKATMYETIEGNTGFGNDANGGQVMMRIRDVKNIVGAFRPKYEAEDDEMASIISQIADEAGLTVDETIKRLGFMAKQQDIKLDAYQSEGVERLKELQLITAHRDGRAQVNWGDFGTVISRLWDKVKN